MANYRLITDGDRNLGEPEFLRFGRNGWEGQREYIVETMEAKAAMDSVPDQYGAPFSAGLPQCQCSQLTTRYLFGKDDASGSGGVSVVRCEFSEPGSNGTLPPPQIGLKYTILGSQSGNQTVYADIRAPSDPGSPPNPLSFPLHNGDGISKAVGLLTAKVYSYIPTTTFPDLARIARLNRRRPVNSDNLTLPNILGTTFPVFLAAGQCQYDGFSHNLVGAAGGVRAIEIIHDLLIAPDFIERWRLEDEEGNLFGDEVQSVINTSEPFTGIW